MDPRVAKLAQVLIHYSLEIKPGQQLAITSYPLADELTLAAYREALEAGAHVTVRNRVPGWRELLFKLASDEQLDYVSPLEKLLIGSFDAPLYIGADQNTRELSNVNPAKQAHSAKTYQRLDKLFNQRAARDELRWCYTIYPTRAMAQEADMSLASIRTSSTRPGSSTSRARFRPGRRRASGCVSCRPGRSPTSSCGSKAGANCSIETASRWRGRSRPRPSHLAGIEP